MAKISLRVFQKGKPIFWIIGGVVVFVVFYMLFNRGAPAASASGGGSTVVQTGPSENLQIAGMQMAGQIQAAQIAANIEALRVQGQRDQAALAGQVALAQLGSGERIALETLAADREAAVLNAQTNLLINEQTANYNLESARLASETTLGLRQIDANLVSNQLSTQAAMFRDQLTANMAMYETQSRSLIATTALGQIQNLKKKNRDEALTAITASLTGTPNYYVPQSDGGFSLGDLVGVISPVAGLLH